MFEVKHKIVHKNIWSHLANHYLKIAILSGRGLGHELGRGLGRAI